MRYIAGKMMIIVSVEHRFSTGGGVYGVKVGEREHIDLIIFSS
jgi:hypothetical protein